MLPSNLFSAKIRKGNVRPNYLSLDESSVSLAKQMMEIFEESVGKKKASLTAKLEELEGKVLFDFKTVRGLAAILDRKCVYVVESKLDPVKTRSILFEEASKRRVVTVEEKNQLLLEFASKMKMNVSPQDVEESLFKDLEEEQILSKFDPIDPAILVKVYNLSLAQTALFKSVSMEFNASGNWKRIFRDIKRFGLMYSVEEKTGTGDAHEYTVYLDGPLSLFKMTERYGTSLAKLLPTIVSGESWSFKADLIDRHRNNRILHFEEDNKKNVPEFASLFSYEEPPLFDSSVEEKFASKFNSLNTGWVLRREPEPLIAGKHVLIPDFSFEKYGYKIFMEIVGFWTKEYIERKLSKLASLSLSSSPPSSFSSNTEIIVALNENLRCSESKLSEISKKAAMVLTYSKDVPLEPIISHLKALEARVEEKQVEELQRNGFFDFVGVGDTVDLVQAAEKRGVSVQVLKRSLDLDGARADLKGYKMVGDYLLSESKIESVRSKLEEKFLGGTDDRGRDLTLDEVSGIIESLGVAASSTELLRLLGYEIEWNGLDYQTSKVRKREEEGETFTHSSNP